MKAIKKGADLIFTCDDGKTVKYNLNTGVCIGKNGKPCMYLNSQLRGYSVDEIANSFEDKNFGKFISHVAKKCSKNGQSIQNIGTVFQRMDEYKREEQIYSAGLTLAGSFGKDYFKGTINEIPKGLVKILREIKDRMIDHLEKFGEYDTPKYRYYIGTDKGCEYVKRYSVRRYGNDIKTIGKTENVRVWKGTSWAIF